MPGGFVCLSGFLAMGLAWGAQAAEPVASLRLPSQVAPVMATWGWAESDFAPGGYEPLAF